MPVRHLWDRFIHSLHRIIILARLSGFVFFIIQDWVALHSSGGSMIWMYYSIFNAEDVSCRFSLDTSAMFAAIHVTFEMELAGFKWLGLKYHKASQPNIDNSAPHRKLILTHPASCNWWDHALTPAFRGERGFIFIVSYPANSLLKNLSFDLYTSRCYTFVS